jgi:AraC family transcriptional regulator
MLQKPKRGRPPRVTPSARFHEARYPGLMSMPMHSHGPAYFSLVLSGGYEERIGSETRQVNGPVILFHPPEEDHAVRFAPVATHIVGIEVSPQLTQRAKEGRLPIGQGQILRTPEALAAGAKLVREFHRGDPFADIALDGLLMELLVMLGRPGKTNVEGTSKAVDLATDLIHHKACFLPSLDELALEVRLHPVSLARGFKQRHGVSITEYVRKRRFELAVTELKSNDMCLADVAAKLGYADQAHFTREFKRAAGVTPGVFRKTYSSG